MYLIAFTERCDWKASKTSKVVEMLESWLSSTEGNKVYFYMHARPSVKCMFS